MDEIARRNDLAQIVNDATAEQLEETTSSQADHSVEQ